MSNFFFCYNKQLSDYLKANGQKFITVAIDPNTRKWFSLYQITPEVSQLLDDYKKLGTSNKGLNSEQNVRY